MIIDLIYVEYTDGRTMVVAIADCPQEGMLGPVNSKGAITALAPMLHEKLPAQFHSVGDAENMLALIHAKNMMAGRNSAGQSYPYIIDVAK